MRPRPILRAEPKHAKHSIRWHPAFIINTIIGIINYIVRT